ncbi:nucleotidyltransferase family protein [Olivibacter sp. XZL3]|uniref:nucleotidyltransferase family protein n=1 Tax=Olivibacter sp. XZL3 TaxID=1735116 RepID=UPI0010654C00|nr:nucleotidyltransferase family protein [Olivibacter sp. XZL3]
MAVAIYNKVDLISLLQANKDRIRSFGVKKLSLFGSFVTNQVKSDSDVDFLVEFNPSMKTYDNFMDLSFFLEDLLGRKVELITPQSLNKHIGPYILKQAEHVRL